MLYAIKKTYKKVVTAAIGCAFVCAFASVIAGYEIGRYFSALTVLSIAVGVSADILGVHATRVIREIEKEPKVHFITLD